jgi:excinuclease ABC subunit A
LKDVKNESYKTHIIIKGARVHNLKNVSVSIPRNKLVVLTGLSGSGKSSLAFNTLFAEGQRRYVESLSSYARQFLGRFDKPDVDSIVGISPAVAIEQKVTGRSSRSTVGTSTEIYDYIKLLYARIGVTFSPTTGKAITKNNTSDVVNAIFKLKNETRFAIVCPLKIESETSFQIGKETLLAQGFSRLVCNNEFVEIQDAEYSSKHTYYLLIDRMSKDDELEASRLGDSVDLAFSLGRGHCALFFPDKKKFDVYANQLEEDGIVFEEPSLNLFSFNNPIGACKSCEGFGSLIGIDSKLVIPNENLSIYQDCIACWKGEKLSGWKDDLIRNAKKADIPIHTPYRELSAVQKKTIWEGCTHFHGINTFFKYLEAETYKIQNRVLLSRYRGRTACPECHGTRLKKEANYVKIANTSVSELMLLPLHKSLNFFETLSLTKNEESIAKRILLEIKNRLLFLCEVGLEYLTLNRLSNTLSGGEAQRIHLATSLGSALVGSMYILDEPSIGLHPRDSKRLLEVLKNLRDQGNTVIVVEHEEEIIRNADYIIDIGPEAGAKGGEIVFEGNAKDLEKKGKTLTGEYLRGDKKIHIEKTKKKLTDIVSLKEVNLHNLSNASIDIPLHAFSVITGVSGSGKSTLIKSVLYPALQNALNGISENSSNYSELSGSISSIKALEFVDQNPIGKSSRSNPATYLKIYDDIRALFTSQPLAKQRNMKPAFFSFNVTGGRCDTCEGEGIQTIEMQFMADVELVCETCKGKRFKEEVLDVQYRGKNIADVLDLTVDEAIEFFGEDSSTSAKHIVQKLTPLKAVGLDYVKLGQSNSTLSGGEAQRIKLASFLIKGPNQPHTLFIFDEPTTGLHFHDVQKLMITFQALLAQGHTVIAIEHHTDVMRCADWIVDIGPEGGEKGGNILYCGPFDAFLKTKSHTADALNS